MPSGRQLGILRWRHAINHPPAWLTTIFIWDRCRAPSSAMGIRGCRSRFAATPLRGRSDHCRCGRRHDGFLRSATKTDPLCQRRTPFRIGRRRDWVISWQLPPDAIPCGFEPVSDADMPAEHLAEKPALEADDMVALHRSPDRDSRQQRCRRGRALAKATERAMHRRNQARELIDADSILRDIATDNPRNQAEINCLRGAFIGHISFTRCFDWVYVVESVYFTICQARNIHRFLAAIEKRKPTRTDFPESPLMMMWIAPDDVDCSFS
jgi:hypothetical protein